MSEEIKNEQEEFDKTIDELLNNPIFKTEEEKKFLNNVVASLKKREIPIELISNKVKESLSKLEDLEKQHPEFESFVKHYQNKINDNMSKMIEDLKNQSSGE
jgi:F0F1-type ATP synthase delta subunit